MGKQQDKGAVSGVLENNAPAIMDEAKMAAFTDFLKNKGYNNGQINQMESAHNEAVQQLQPEKNLGLSATDVAVPNTEYEKSALSDLGTGIYNSFVDLGEGAANLIPTIATAAGADNKFWDTWMNGVSNWAEDSKGMLSDAANKPFSEEWNLHNWSAGLGQGLGFMATLATGGGAFARVGQAAGLVSDVDKLRKVGQFMSGTMSMTPGLYKEGIDAGLSKANSARMALGLSGLISLTEGIAFNRMGKIIDRPFASKEAQAALKENISKFSTKGLSELDFNEAMKVTGLSFAQKMKNHGAKAFVAGRPEAVQEFAQEYIEEGAKQLYDTVFAKGKEKGEGAYGADVMSWNTFENAVVGGTLGGMIGGGNSVLGLKGSLMSGIKGESLFGYIDNAVKTKDQSKMQTLGNTINQMAAEGKLADTPEAVIEHIGKIQKFTEHTKGLDLPSSTAKYQLFQMMELQTGMADKIGEKFSMGESVHPAVAAAYKKNVKLAEQISGALNEDIKKVIEDQKPLDKNREKFESTLSKYVALYQGVIKGTLNEEQLEKWLPKTSYALKDQVKQEKAEAKEEEKTNSTETVENVSTEEKSDEPKLIMERPGAGQEFMPHDSDIKYRVNETTGKLQHFVEGLWSNSGGDDVILSTAEKKGYRPVESTTQETTTSDNVTKDDQLISIVKKIRDNEKLTDDERSVYMNNTADVNRILVSNNIGQEKFNQEKNSPNAIQESKTTGVDVRQQTGHGQKVGEGNPKGKENTKTDSQEKEQEIKPYKIKEQAQQKRKALLAAPPVSLEHAVLQKISKGLKLDAKDFQHYTGLDPKTEMDNHPFQRILLDADTKSQTKTDIHRLWEDMHSDPNLEGLIPDNDHDFAQRVFNQVAQARNKAGALQMIEQMQPQKGQYEDMNSDELNQLYAQHLLNEKNSEHFNPEKQEEYENFVHSLSDEEAQAQLDALEAADNDPDFQEKLLEEYERKENPIGNENETGEQTGSDRRGEKSQESGESQEQPTRQQRNRQSVADTRELISQNPTLYNKIKDLFQKVFPSITVNEINDMLWVHGADVLARVSKDGIDINTDKAFQNSIIHEYAHVYLDMLGPENPLVQVGLQQIKPTPYMEWAKEQYPEYSEEQQAAEALVEALSQDSERKLRTRFEGTQLQKFMLWAKTFWNKIKSLISPGAAANIINDLSDALIKGKDISPEAQPKIEGEQEQRNKTRYTPTLDDEPLGLFNKSFTVKLLGEHPDLAKRIIDRLKRLYPKVNIYEDGLFDKDGNWSELPLQKYGMSYRDGLTSAVAWANDSLLETPPHEYAHIYVDMFRNVPMVQKAIEGYGEENLVQKMGEYFANRETSGTFTKWVNDFWAMVKSFFGSPDVAEELSKAFYEGQQLAPEESMGTGIYNYQERGKPMTKIKGTFNGDGFGLTESDAKMMSSEQAEQEIFDAINPEKESGVKKLAPNWVQNNFNNTFKKLLMYSDSKDSNSEYRNMAGLDRREISDAMNIIDGEKNQAAIGKYLSGEITRHELSEKQKRCLDLAVLAHKRIEYRRKLNESVFSETGKLAELGQVQEIVDNSIVEAAKNRVRLYDKLPIKSKKLRKVLQNIEKTLLRYSLAPRLDAKYLSGSEASLLSKIFYDSLNHADSRFKGILREFDKQLQFRAEKGKFKKWSTFNTPKQDIGFYEGRKFKLTVGDKTDQDVKLTKSELLTLYMNLRQNFKGVENRTSPAEAIRTYGFKLDQEIEGRDIKPGDILQFPRTDEEISQGLPSKQELDFMKAMESNPELMEIVDQADKAMGYMYDETNNTFEQEQGYRLPKIENYFPVYTGEKSIEISQRKNAIEEFRAGHERLGSDGPMRIADFNKVLSFHRNNGALYASHALPVSNNRKLLDKVRNKYQGTMEATYIDKMDGLLNDLNDSSLLYSSQGEKEFNNFFNRMTNNFAVSVLALNLPTVFKQGVGSLALKEEIDYKYLKQAGWGIGGLTGITPKQFIKTISITGFKKGETWMPVEWKADTNNPSYKEIMEHSDKLAFRMEGSFSREAGEILMDASGGSDAMTLPFFKDKSGNPITISKSRLLEGMKTFDNNVVMKTWNAVKLEAVDKYKLTPGTQEYWEHVAGRTEDIITKTQGAYEGINRTELSRSKSPFARFITMFGSQTSTLGMLILDGTIGYINNPTKENRAKLIKRYANIMVTSSLAIATIDVLKHGLLHGFDDDDDVPKDFMLKTAANALGNIYFLSQISRLIISRMDNEPWTENVQMPVESLANQLIQGMYDIGRVFKTNEKGDMEYTIDNGLYEMGKGLFMASGVPLAPFTQTSSLFKSE